MVSAPTGGNALASRRTPATAAASDGWTGGVHSFCSTVCSACIAAGAPCAADTWVAL